MRVTTSVTFQLTDNIYEYIELERDSYDGWQGQVEQCGGPSQSDKSQERQISTQETAIAADQNKRADNLQSLVLPGIQKSEDYYSKIASGDPHSIFTAIAPATEQISAQADAAKARIQQEMPRGGEQRLAMENNDISKASAIGRTATTAYNSAFPALASMGGTFTGLSANEVSNAISAFGGASNATGTVMSADASGKAATMGFMSSLAGAGATAFAGA